MKTVPKSSKQENGEFDYCHICGLPGQSCPNRYMAPPNLYSGDNLWIQALGRGLPGCHMHKDTEDGVPLGFGHDNRYSKVFAADTPSSLRIKGGLAKGPLLKSMSKGNAKSKRTQKN